MEQDQGVCFGKNGEHAAGTPRFYGYIHPATPDVRLILAEAPAGIACLNARHIPTDKPLEPDGPQPHIGAIRAAPREIPEQLAAHSFGPGIVFARYPPAYHEDRKLQNTERVSATLITTLNNALDAWLLNPNDATKEGRPPVHFNEHLAQLKAAFDRLKPEYAKKGKRPSHVACVNELDMPLSTSQSRFTREHTSWLKETREW
jgi:hypothetical protein